MMRARGREPWGTSVQCRNRQRCGDIVSLALVSPACPVPVARRFKVETRVNNNDLLCSVRAQTAMLVYNRLAE